MRWSKEKKFQKFTVKEEDKRLSNGNGAFFADMSSDTRHEVNKHLDLKDVINLSKSCVRLFSLYQPDLEEARLMLALLQAVIVSVKNLSVLKKC